MSEEKHSEVRIGLFGTWGFKNMGDAAVANATVAGLKRHLANVEFTAICQQPENVLLGPDIRSISVHRVPIKNSDLVFEGNETQRTVTVETSPAATIKKLLKRIKPLFLLAKAVQRALLFAKTLPKELAFSMDAFQTARSLDLIVMAGSGQFTDEWGGPWRYPFGLFRWCLMARLAGCKIAFLSVGVGEIDSGWTKFFCSTACRLAHYRSVRDVRSKEIVESWGVKNIKLVPDMAFSINFEHAKPEVRTGGSLTIGINPIAYGDPRTWNEPDPDVYKNYIEKLVQFCNWLLSSGHRLVFVPNDLLMENLTIDDIIANLGPEFSGHQNIIRPKVDDHKDIFLNLAKCDAVICCRFHGLLFSLMSSRPIISLAHHYKFFKLADTLGQEKYCRDIATFEVEELKNLFFEVIKNKDAISKEILERRQTYAEQVEDQYRRMAELVKL